MVEPSVITYSHRDATLLPFGCTSFIVRMRIVPLSGRRSGYWTAAPALIIPEPQDLAVDESQTPPPKADAVDWMRDTT